MIVWRDVFLGVIAVATLAIAIAQVGVIIAAGLMARRVGRMVDQLVTKLNEGEGTAGQLLKDKQLYENMNGAVTDMRALLTAIQKDPKKYLNVKVSIF